MQDPSVLKKKWNKRKEMGEQGGGDEALLVGRSPQEDVPFLTAVV